MNYQTTRNNSCGDNRCNSCPYGRTPWGTREACGCGRRPWNTRTCCNTCNTPRSSCPCAANTTWRNRGEGCGCATTRIGNCHCNEVRETRNGCGCTTRETRSDCGCTTRETRSDCGCTTTRETRSGCGCSESRRDSDCDSDCNHGAANTGILDGKSLAMVYSPYQTFDSVYDPRKGLCSGTIFGELNKPFYGDGRDC